MVKFHPQSPIDPHPSPRFSRSRPLRQVVAGTLIFMVGCFSSLSPDLELTAQAQTPATSTTSAPQSQPLPSGVLGVVQSPDNVDQWQAIVDRLDASGMPYEVIDWEQVQRDTPFAGITILFLPDVSTISAEQVLALQSWLNRGGRLIVSGATGSNASAGVQRALRSLVGAYWDSELSEPVQLHPVVLNSQRWLRQGETEDSIRGGVLIPTDLSSQSVATWRDPEANSTASTGTTQSESLGRVAIVVTRQSTFLGWRWGSPDSGSIAFDGSWLRAALSRFEDASLVSPSVAAGSQQPQAGSRERGAESQELGVRSRENGLPTTPTDREIAAPGLVVQPGTAPISLVEAIAMRQELENLIGRFESALLAANAAMVGEVGTEPTQASEEEAEPEAEPEAEAEAEDQPIRGRSRLDSRSSENREVGRTASTDPGVFVGRESQDERRNEILQEARRQLADFLDLVQQQDYAAARQTWLQARQLLWDHLPTDRPLAQTEIRAIWLDRETIVAARSEAGLARLFDRLADAGINTIFFETVNAGYPIYPSEVAPQQNPLIRNWDPLAAAVDLAHERGMELHAWVWTFAAGNGDHNRLVNLPLDYPGPLISAYPSWAGYDNQGSLTLPGQDEPFLDPANPEVRSYLQDLYEEIVTRYDVDGLQLDYIRYPFQNPSAGRTYGYGIAARQQFQRLTGVDPITLSASAQGERSRQWQQWTEFRVEQVNSFVAETSTHLRQLRPDLILSAAVFPMPEQERVQKIQQDWELWAQQGDVDLIVIMTYAADTNRLQQLASPWITATHLDSTLVIPGLRLLDLPDTMVFDQIQALRDWSAGGYALFAAAHLGDSLQTILSQTQATHSADPIPYRQPYAAANRQFAALQREWNFLLTQDQLWMRPAEREDWQAKTEALAKILNSLTEDPSDSNLEQAKEQIQQFQSEFDDWMHLQALTERYRVQTWQNRLATIEQLLNYGERIASRQRYAIRNSANP